MQKRIIWSNMDVDVNAWKADYKEFLETDNVECDDSELWAWIHDTLELYLQDERENLNVQTDGRILVIADLGLWNGRKQGYKILNGNVANILSDDADYIEWYSDGYNIKATASHHDGTNYYEYRVIREDKNVDNLLDAIYNGEEINRKKLNYYTKSLHSVVAEIYGW